MEKLLMLIVFKIMTTIKVKEGSKMMCNDQKFNMAADYAYENTVQCSLINLLLSP